MDIEINDNGIGFLCSEKENGKVISSLYVFKNNGVGCIECVSTMEGFERKGYASRLLKGVMDYKIADEFAAIIRKEDYKSIGLFKKCGFDIKESDDKESKWCSARLKL